MYWKLIGSLWILGFLLEIASFMDLFSGRDVWVWSAYGLTCAVIIARLIPERQFSMRF